MTAHAQPEVAASLRAAIDGLPHGDGRAEAIVRLQGELLNAQASVLIRVGGAGEQPVIALRAAREDRLIHERDSDKTALAMPLGREGDEIFVAVHLLERPTPLALALAQERLELTAALMRGRSADGGGTGDAAVALIEAHGAVARHRALADAARQAQQMAGARRVIVARFARGRVVAIADSDLADPSGEAAAGLKLAAGEVYDLTHDVDPGDALPPTLATLAGGTALHAFTARDGTRAIVIIAIGAADPQAAKAAARLLLHARLRRIALPPQSWVDRAARLPWPEAWPADQRQAAGRRAILLAPLLVLLVPLPVGVSAPVTVEPLNRRVVTAPHDGRLDAVLVEPGDTVAAGQPLARLDTAASGREREEVIAGQQSALSEAGNAALEGRSDDERIARLRAEQLGAQAELLRLTIADAQVAAPIAGVVGGEDLRRRIGAPMSRGETLFVIAGAGGFRAEIRVPDRRIAPVAVGDTVSLSLKANVLRRPSGVVSRIYPIAETADGNNIFRVVATLTGDGAGLLPGMEGQASIHTGWAPIGWTILKVPLRWLRQTLWI